MHRKMGNPFLASDWISRAAFANNRHRRAKATPEEWKLLNDSLSCAKEHRNFFPSDIKFIWTSRFLAARAQAELGGAEVWVSLRPVACRQLGVRFLQWKNLPQTLKTPVNFGLLPLRKLLTLQGFTSTSREVAAWSFSCNVGQEHRPGVVLKWIQVSSR